MARTPYEPTIWANNNPPAINSANLGKIEQELALLDTDQISLRNEIKLDKSAEKSFSVTEGVAHSANNGPTNINIPIGEKFSISCRTDPEDGVSGVSVYAYYSDSTDEVIYNGTFEKLESQLFVAVKEIIKIGFYISKWYALKTCAFYDTIYVGNYNQRIAALEYDLAYEYKSFRTYSVGQLCLKDNQLYKCIVAISTAENWDASHWEAVNVSSLYNEYLLSNNSINVAIPTAALISTSQYTYINIDTVNKLVEIPNDMVAILNYNRTGRRYIAMPSASISYADAGSGAIVIYYDMTNNEFVLRRFSISPPNNNCFIVMTLRTGSAIPGLSIPIYTVNGVLWGVNFATSRVIRRYDNSYVKSIGHRGCNAGPENTMPAFLLAQKSGFKFIETDVSFTSDNVAVLLHDNTINRTARNADGTEISGEIDISSITYEQALTYDFGIWRGAAFAGTKIPTLKEFLEFCRGMGVHPYIEIKNVTGQTQIEIIDDIVNRCGMRGKVTYIDQDETRLQAMILLDSVSRIGYIKSAIAQQYINTALAMKTDKNEVFLDTRIDYLTDQALELCIAAGLPTEIWTVDSPSVIKTLNPYISGITSNSQISEVILGDYYLDGGQ